MPNETHFDIVIIGSGAGGGAILHRLAPSGKRICVLERGGFLKREKENWSSRAVLVENRYKADETWLDRNGAEFHPGTHYCVGGNTKVYGAALFRFRERDFETLRHHGGVSPAWPIRYADMAPYYSQAERLFQVHGLRGSDPTEPAADEPFPHAPVSHEPRMQELVDDLRELGLNPFPVPLGIQLDEAQPERSRCIRCATCDGFPCLLHAKSDAEVCCVLPALEHANVTMITGATVQRLETSASGREVSAVVFERDGRTERVSGDTVIVSCGAINSAALLLRSTGARHPNGLANSSGMVGRHYMCHNNSALLAISRRPNPTVFQKTIAINDFYFGADDWDFPLGHISMLGKSDADALSLGAPGFAPKVALSVMASHSIDFWLTSEDLPDPENRVTLDERGRVVLRYEANNEEGHKRLVSRLKSMLGKIGCESTRLLPNALYLGKKIPLAGVAHQCGTLRFGADPKASVLDANCRAHDVDNLYVVDASFFPSSAAINPALTIIANALRVGDHLLAQLN